MSEKHKEVMESWGEHLSCSKVVNGKVYALSRFLFTTGFLLEVDTFSYKGRYCFHTKEQAQAFYDAYDGSQEAVVGKDGCTAIK